MKEEFDYQIIYKKRKSNTNTGALSRIEINLNESAKINNIFDYVKEFNDNLVNENSIKDSVIVNIDEQSQTNAKIENTSNDAQTQYSN